MILKFFPVGPIACNCIVIADEQTKETLVIDPGDDIGVINRHLAALEARVIGILATHAHIDHVGSLADLKETTRAPVMLHEADLPLYENIALQASWLGVPTPHVTTIDKFLHQGDSLKFGAQTLRVMHTPGHSPGSVCFVVNGAERTIFSGDTLFAGGIGRTDLWGGSYDQIIRSIISKLLPFDDDVAVIPGHGNETTIGVERRTNPFILQAL